LSLAITEISFDNSVEARILDFCSLYNRACDSKTVEVDENNLALFLL